MVSNSGTMLMALRPDGLTRPTSFKSTATSSMSDMPLHIEMMHCGITSAPNFACASAAAWNTASSPSVSSLYLTKAELSGRALRSSFEQQRRCARPRSAPDRTCRELRRRTVPRPCVHARRNFAGCRAGRDGSRKQSTARRKMPQPPARDHAGIVGDQRAVEHVEIGLELRSHWHRARPCRPAAAWFPPPASARSRSAGHKCRTPPADTARRFDAAK